MGVSRPPYLVPPKDLCLWDIEDEKDYKSWMRRTGNKLSTKEEFRQHIIDLNDKFDMEEVFENLEVGLYAFQKLVIFCSEFPQYSLMKDLEGMYVEKDNIIVKDFIKLGDNFVRTYQTDQNEEKESVVIVENDLEKLSQLSNESTFQQNKQVVKEECVEPDIRIKEEIEVVEQTAVVIDSAVDISNLVKKDVNVQGNEEQLETAGRRKKKNKKKRMERLLKFHQKLVHQSGLPPSRLMELQTPKLKSTGEIKRRKLFDEFNLPGESVKDQ